MATKRKASSSVVDTHKDIVAFLLTKASDDLFEVDNSVNGPVLTTARSVDDSSNALSTKRSRQRLKDLRQQRIYLASEVARARLESQISSIDLCSQDLTSSFSPKTVLQDVSSQLQPQSSPSAFDINNNPPSSSSLALSLQQVRTKRKLVAGYRLGGITAAIPHADSEVLSIRFDICLDEPQGEGSTSSYVACYHAFFDLIVEATHRDDDDDDEDGHGVDPSSALFLRLVQHTIPSAVPTLTICETVLGGSLFPLGSLHNKDEWNTSKLKTGIRSWCRQIYQACWCWERRKQDWKYLENLQKQQRRTKEQAPLRRGKGAQHGRKSEDGTKALALAIEKLATTAPDSLHRISFHLSWRTMQCSETVSQGKSLGVFVNLIYDDWVRGLPTNVDVKAVQQRQASSFDSGSVSVSQISMENNHEELEDLVREAFLTKSVKNALELLQDHKEQLLVS